MNMDYSIVLSLLVTCKVILFVIVPLILSALVTAYLIMLENKYINSIVEIIINIPIIFPPIGIGFVLVLCLSKNSYLGGIFNFDIIFSFSGICIAAYLTGLPFIVRAVMSGIDNNIKELCEAAYTLGKSRRATFILIVIPILKNCLLQGIILAVGRIIGEVGITLMIGGNIDGKTTTVSLDIYNAVMDGENDKAMILGGILFVFSFALFYLLRRIGNKVYSI